MECFHCTTEEVILYLASKEITIIPKSTYIEERSDVSNHLYFFVYNIQILNESDKTYQLLSRYWEITDSNQNKQIIKGDGVVGEQPIIKPKQKYSYHSFCPLKTQFGTMKGYYIFKENLLGDEYEVKIPEFILTVPSSIN